MNARAQAEMPGGKPLYGLFIDIRKSGIVVWHCCCGAPGVEATP